ncbi:VanZ family protein [Pullulanibacillus pueri]|uniref:VanZ-like domain-containing protein n=1 Tax=Pullulanibacillus pueri TaxID=1437324 RepID=A0A8J2ZWK2_9BACL|nr:VanZ family protein [Pullulanibacillus pueri]GGH81270.1 hypothetical protein GCM10007096_18920 [Pullulanibacillus pueri]
MKAIQWLKKIAVFIPYLLLLINIIWAKFSDFLFSSLSLNDLLNLFINTLPLTILVLIDLVKRKPSSLFQLLIQASFYVYLLAVWYITLSRESVQFVFTNPFWMHHINLIPFVIFRDFSLFNEQIIGNVIMLMPLGMYIHLLFKPLASPLRAFVTIFLVSFSIELLQLLFSVGSSDIDDLILNTSGGYLAYLIFGVLIFLYKKSPIKFNQQKRTSVKRSTYKF